MSEQNPPRVSQQVSHVGSDRPLTRAEAEQLEDAVQEQAVVAWRIHRDERRNNRLLVRWALRARMRALLARA